MTSEQLRRSIRDIYRQVDAPEWAAPNLDALADVLRDLSWLAPGPVSITVGAGAELTGPDLTRLRRVLDRAVAESNGSPHPLRVDGGPDGR